MRGERLEMEVQEESEEKVCSFAKLFFFLELERRNREEWWSSPLLQLQSCVCVRARCCDLPRVRVSHHLLPSDLPRVRVSYTLTHLLEHPFYFF